jgi:hypothetical protein
MAHRHRAPRRTIRRNGMEGGDGIITLMLGVVTILIGVTQLTATNLPT